MSILLVQMPYADIERPSLALGILHAALRRAGLTSEVVYGNLAFAEHVGLEPLRLIRQIPEHFLVGEWTFSGAAFPRYSPPEGYLEYLRENLGPLPELSELRQNATEFVEQMATRVLAKAPRIVGCTSTFQQHCASLGLLRAIKERDPSVFTVVGGANCEGPMGKATLASFPWVDVVVSGEADLLVAELMQKMLEGRLDDLPYGAMSRKQLPPEAPRARVGNLEESPVPDFDSYFQALASSKLRASVQPGLLMEGSRGCWWGAKHHCTFCGLNGTGMAYRQKSSERILEEMETLTERYAVNSVEMVDNILSMNSFKTLLPQLAEKSAPYNIFYEVKANLRKEQVQLLSQAGVGWVQPGLESLNDEVLELLDKGTTALQNVQFLRYAREFGVRVTWLLLTQVPHERDEWYQELVEWLPLISHLQPPTRAVRLRYDRFSPYQIDPSAHGLKIEPEASYGFVYPPETDLDNLAYFFRDREGTAPPGREPPDGRPGLTHLNEQVMNWVTRFWRWPDLLCMTPRGEDIKILDTRPIRVERDTVLTGLPAKVLQACDSPRTESWLKENLTGDVESALEELQRLRLILRLYGKVLSLPVAGKIPSLPKRSDFPGGRTLAKA